MMSSLEGGYVEEGRGEEGRGNEVIAEGMVL